MMLAAIGSVESAGRRFVLAVCREYLPPHDAPCRGRSNYPSADQLEACRLRRPQLARIFRRGLVDHGHSAGGAVLV